jgi:hypothetical protein
VRFSGGGFHVLVPFKEPVRRWLTDTLSADPLPNHYAALLRTVRSVNYKYGDAREVTVLREGIPIDITEAEEFAANLVRPLFSVKEGITTARASDNIIPFDADQRLASMTPGVDVNDTLFRAVGSRLCSGVPMEDVVAELTEAAMAKATGADWSPESQRNEIEHMCLLSAQHR